MFTKLYGVVSKVPVEIDPYEELANAIIIRAADDYRKALSAKEKGKIISLEKFFLSDWFRILSRADGQYIIDKIKDDFIR